MTITREEAIEVRKLTYEDLQRSKRHALQLSGDYGKWLIASLLLVHGASVAFLAQNDILSKTVFALGVLVARRRNSFGFPLRLCRLGELELSRSHL